MSHFETEYDKILRELAIRCDQAWGLYAQNKLDEALELAENLLQEEPRLPATHKAVLHVLLSKSQDINKAVEHAKKAVNRYRWIKQDSKGAFTSSDHSKFFNKRNLRHAEEDFQILVRLQRLRMGSLQDKQAGPDGSQDDTSQEDGDSQEDSDSQEDNDSQEENGSQEDIDLANRVLIRLRAPPRSPTPTGDRQNRVLYTAVIAVTSLRTSPSTCDNTRKKEWPWKEIGRPQEIHSRLGSNEVVWKGFIEARAWSHRQ